MERKDFASVMLDLKDALNFEIITIEEIMML
jgi:hypothetical protein